MTIKIIDSLGFIKALHDSRYLLIYPDFVNKLTNMIILFSPEQVEQIQNIFNTLIDFRALDKSVALTHILNNSSNNILANVFPLVRFIDVTNLTNANIGPLQEKDRKGLIAQAAIPFTSDQLISLLNILPQSDLDTLVGTLTQYQIKELSAKFTKQQKANILSVSESYANVTEMQMIGVF